MFPLALRHSKRMVVLAPRFAVAVPAAKKAALAGFSTQQAQAAVESVENVLHQNHWADILDEVKAIRHLLTEFKTNHSVAVPAAGYEEQVAAVIKNEVFGAANNGTQQAHDEAFEHIHDLKGAVKEKLYPH